jgi:hypothetical protein
MNLLPLVSARLPAVASGDPTQWKYGGAGSINWNRVKGVPVRVTISWRLAQELITAFSALFLQNDCRFRSPAPVGRNLSNLSLQIDSSESDGFEDGPIRCQLLEPKTVPELPEVPSKVAPRRSGSDRPESRRPRRVLVYIYSFRRCAHHGGRFVGARPCSAPHNALLRRSWT